MSLSQRSTARRPAAAVFLVIVVPLILVSVSRVASAEIWGIKSCGSSPETCPDLGIPSEPPTQLFRFAEDGSALVPGPFLLVGGQQIDADGLALSSGGALFAFRLLDSKPPPASGSTLISIDPLSGSSVVVGGSLAGREILGATFDETGRLWAVDRLADELLEIDPATGSVIGAPIALTLDTLPFALPTSSDLAARANGTMLLLAGTDIHELDTTTGALTLLHEETLIDADASTVPSFVGLAVATEPGQDLFMLDIQIDDDIYAYDVGFTPTEPYSNILSDFNSGRGDLASSPPPPVPSVAEIPLGVLALGLVVCGLFTIGGNRTKSQTP